MQIQKHLFFVFLLLGSLLDPLQSQELDLKIWNPKACGCNKNSSQGFRLQVIEASFADKNPLALSLIREFISVRGADNGEVLLEYALVNALIELEKRRYGLDFRQNLDRGIRNAWASEKNLEAKIQVSICYLAESLHLHYTKYPEQAPKQDLRYQPAKVIAELQVSRPNSEGIKGLNNSPKAKPDLSNPSESTAEATVKSSAEHLNSDFSESIFMVYVLPALLLALVAWLFWQNKKQSQANGLLRERLQALEQEQNKLLVSVQIAQKEKQFKAKDLFKEIESLQAKVKSLERERDDYARAHGLQKWQREVEQARQENQALQSEKQTLQAEFKQLENLWQNEKQAWLEQNAKQKQELKQLSLAHEEEKQEHRQSQQAWQETQKNLQTLEEQQKINEAARKKENLEAREWLRQAQEREQELEKQIRQIQLQLQQQQSLQLALEKTAKDALKQSENKEQNLKKEIQNKENLLAKQSRQIQNLEQTLTLAKEESQEQNLRLKEQANRLLSLEQSLKTWQDTAQEQAAQLLQGQNLSKQLSDLQNQYDQALKQVQNLEQTLQNKQKQLDAEQKQAQNQNQIQGLEQNLQQALKQIQNLEQTLQNQQKQLDAEQKQAQNQNQIQGLEQNLQQALKQRDQALKQVQNLEQTLQNQQKQLDAEQKQAQNQNQIQGLEQNLQQALKQIELFKQELAQAKADLEHQKKQAPPKPASKDNPSLEELGKQIAILKLERMQEQQQFRQVEKRLEEAQKQIKQQNQQLADWERRQADWQAEAEQKRHFYFGMPAAGGFFHALTAQFKANHPDNFFEVRVAEGQADLASFNLITDSYVLNRAQLRQEEILGPTCQLRGMGKIQLGNLRQQSGLLRLQADGVTWRIEKKIGLTW